MYKLIFSLVFVALFSGLAAAAGAPAYEDEPSGAYLRDWLLLGPFPAGEPHPEWGDNAHLTGFATDFLGGEPEAAPRAGNTVAGPDGALEWRRYASPADVVSLDDAVSKADNVLAYAYCEIEAAADTPVLCAIGTNDGARMWLNGERVYDSPVPRGLRIDADIVPLLLRAGTNRLLLKVEERGNLWEFAVRLLPFDVDGLGKRLQLFRVSLKQDGTLELRFLHGEALSKGLLAEAALRVERVGEPGEAVWEGPWNGRFRMPLPIGTAEYGEYVLRVDATLVGGAKHQSEVQFAAGKPVDYTLFADAKSDYVIVLSQDASESERWAAGELQHWLREAGAPELPILAPAAAAGRPAIVVGWNPRSAELLNLPARPEPAAESFVYRSGGADIAICGGGERGTMYGVLTFLEREFGARWYTPRVSAVPKRDAWTFRVLRHREAPGIRVRNDFYFEAFEPIWAARNKVNGAMGYREQPGGVESYWAVHTFYPLMPPAEFYEEHPEYYSLINGERIHDHAQLCLTNPDVLNLITERLRERMRNSPEYLIYSVSQNDWRNPCQCDACQAIAGREGSEAGPLIWFVNQVAGRIEEEFPDKYVGTLAYQYTRKPPRTLRPRENVVIRLCSIECCFAHPFTGCPVNQSFLEDLRGWAEISPHLYIWDYVVNFAHYVMPFPNFAALQPNIQTFRDNKAIGIMEQAAYQSRGGEFAELRAYVLSKLLWDPECDMQAVIDDFMHGYYGRAGQYVRAYFDLLHAQVTPDTHLHIFQGPEDRLFSDDFIRRARALFDRAETVADNVEILQRVEMARMPLMYVQCVRHPVQSVLDGTYARFSAIMERENITHLAESGAPHRQAFHERMNQAAGEWDAQP